MSLLSIGLDDEMGVEVKLPDKQMAVVKKMQSETTASIYALTGAFAGIAGSILFLAWKSKRR
jgi:hypothetical protein